MKKLLLIFFIPTLLLSHDFTKKEIARWKETAKRVTIIRDNWGIPHIYGKSDADAVFGLMYAQCEDDFKRIEMNYVEKLGRMAEVKGESALAYDLYIRLVISADDAMSDYKKSPNWLHVLLNAYADGINYFLYTHPDVHPASLTRFEPWFPLLWTDGSIGAISTGNVTSREVAKLYLGGDGSTGDLYVEPEERLVGSNGFAIAPSRTASGNAILYINPHVTFYFRPEVHVSSQEGLNVYGAVTWGQFFVYQGFNEHGGWMHTSSAVDVSDMYVEDVVKQGEKSVYRYDGAERPVTERSVTLKYKSGDAFETKHVSAMFTHHGPIMAKRNGQFISVRSQNRMMDGLIQCWQRNKSAGFEPYKKILNLRANASNNTVFADVKGNIAYWHGNFVPRRDPALDWSKAVDGTTSATEWRGLHNVDEIVHVYNPASGWIQNCNSTPYTVSGSASPKKENYPAYMAPDGENFRGLNAVRVLDRENKFTLDKVIAAGYDPTLSAFEILIPPLVDSLERTIKPGDSLYAIVNEPLSVLKKWDFRTGENSVATTLAVEYGQLWATKGSVSTEKTGSDAVERARIFAGAATVQNMLPLFLESLRDLGQRYGSWNIPWGEINRYQRLNGDLDEKHDDAQPSLPVGFASARWGMLASFDSRPYPGTKKFYGGGGASFICAVEFGKRIKAKSLLTGGESGDPSSKHFSDQALMYTKGEFKDVLFYKEDVLKHAERSYHPGN